MMKENLYPLNLELFIRKKTLFLNIWYYIYIKKRLCRKKTENNFWYKRFNTL